MKCKKLENRIKKQINSSISMKTTKILVIAVAVICACSCTGNGVKYEFYKDQIPEDSTIILENVLEV